MIVTEPDAGVTIQTNQLHGRRTRSGANRLVAHGLFPLATVLLLSACGKAYPPGISSVLGSDVCEGLPAGITQLGYSDLARLMGNTRVIDSPGGGFNTGDLLLLGFSKGNQPGQGFALKVVDAEVREQVAYFTFEWTVPTDLDPAQDRPSNPCQVLAMDSGHFDQAIAVDQNGSPLGELFILPTS